MASDYKRSNKSMQVFSNNGLVKIRLLKGGTIYTINQQRELEELAATSNLNAPITFADNIQRTAQPTEPNASTAQNTNEIINNNIANNEDNIHMDRTPATSNHKSS